MTDGLPTSFYAWLATPLLFLSAGAAVLSALLERSGPIRLRHFAEEGGGVLLAQYEAPHRFEAFRYLLTVMAKVAGAAFGLSLVPPLQAAGLGVGLSLAVAFGAVASLAAIVELGNRAMVAQDPEGTLRRLTWVIRSVVLLLAPLVSVLAPLFKGRVLERVNEEEDAASEDEIQAYIEVGTQEGILEPGEGEMIRGIVDLGDTQAKSVMTPRIDMVCGSVATPLDELAERFSTSRHSRLPLYRDSVDHIVSILHIQDLLTGLRTEPRPPVAELARPAFFIPGTKPVAELLRDFQASRQQMAIVVDEYGGTMGLVTVEDLVEEIVGEILDEHESLDEGVEALPGGWRLDGRTPLEKLEDLCGIPLNDQPYETVGGLILGLRGDVPSLGEVVEVDGLRLTVEQVVDRRIGTVRVDRLPTGRAVAANKEIVRES